MDGETTRRRAFQLLAGALEYPRPGLAGLLRFLAVCDDANLSGEIVHEALLPALERMGADGDPPAPSPPGESQERARQGYWPVLQAVRLALQHSWQTTYEGR